MTQSPAVAPEATCILCGEHGQVYVKLDLESASCFAAGLTNTQIRLQVDELAN